jgi:hypothetical protein
VSTIIASIPDDECLVRGGKYVCEIAHEMHGRDGTVSDETGVVRWRYYARKNSSGHTWGNPFNKRDFVIADPTGQAELVIRRISFIPSIFHLLDGDRVVGRIRMRSLLRLKYAIEVAGLNTWIFRMPPFTMRFRGNSGKRTDIWALVGPTKKQWGVLIRPDFNDERIVAAVAFIHNEWFNYS